MLKSFLPGVLLMTFFMIFGCGQQNCQKESVEYVNAQLDKLAPVELECDLSNLSDSDKKVLSKLVQAGKIIDELFLIQVDTENPHWLKTLESSPKDKPYLDLFTVMFGPWNRLEEEHPFLGTKAKPKGAGFYPEDMTKEEFHQAIAASPELENDFANTFTVIKRENGQLKAVPYHQVYADYVQKISVLLEEAAALTDDPTLEKFLKLRARDFLTDDYFESDMAWMDLAGNLEVVVGPYEVYEDNLFNYKAAYESFICVVDHEESEKLAVVSKYLNDMEHHLPIPNKYKNFNRGSSSPVKVVTEVYSAGDTKAGIQTTAFNLPNDERVREAKGSKKVMLKNIAKAKYDKCWIPIVQTVLAEKPLKNVSFDAYFNHVLMHEMSHGIGPGIIKINGTETTVQKELKELYSTIEECKADILGVYNMKFMIDKGVFPRDMEYSVYASYLGGMLRSIRFGIEEAHGGGVAIQWNYLFEKGAFITDENGKLDVDVSKIEDGVKALSKDVLMIEALGDYKAAKAFVDKYKVMSPLMQKCVDDLKHVPIDIRPSFPVVNELMSIK